VDTRLHGAGGHSMAAALRLSKRFLSCYVLQQVLQH